MSDNVQVALAETRDATSLGTSEFHASAILSQPDVELAWICAASSERAEALASTLGSAAKTTDSFGALLEDSELDALVIAGGAAGSESMAADALRAGKSVLFEAPAGLSSEGWQSLKDAESSSSGVLALHSSARFHPGWNAALERIRSGEFGPMHAVRLHANSTAATDLMHDLAARLVEESTACIEMPVSSISSLQSSVRLGQDGAPSEVSASWSYSGGPFVQLFCSNAWDSPPGVPISRTEVHCKDAKLEFFNLIGDSRTGKVLIEQEELLFEQNGNYAAQLANVVPAFRNGTAPASDVRAGSDVSTILATILSKAENIHE